MNEPQARMVATGLLVVAAGFQAALAKRPGRGGQTISAKRINKLIKETKLKVTSQIQGDQVRVTGKNRDDLQTAIAEMRSKLTELELQFINFRD
jgi:uncharacterized protein YajQ (UPF0234 family)